MSEREAELAPRLARSATDIVAAVAPGQHPTAEQAAVIEAVPAPALVVAGAGSGKTETLSLRMLWLLDNAERLWGAPLRPEEILCLTFTRKAAAEIAERSRARIEALYGIDEGVPTVSTYNGYAAGLVAEHGLRVGADPDAVVLTEAAQWQIASDVVETWSEDVDHDGAVSTLVDAVMSTSAALADHGAHSADLARWATQAADEVAALPTTARTGPESSNGDKRALEASLRARASLAPLVEEYRRRKVAAGAIDYSDQIVLGRQLAGLEAVREAERARYRVVLLDEFQDTSPGQLELFAALFGAGHPVMAVGDPNQAIYGFRGASPHALAAFTRRFSEGDNRVAEFSLAVSWRNEAAVLEAANAIAAPLRADSPVDVAPLRSRGAELGQAEPARQAPAVQATILEDTATEAALLVRDLQARRAEVAATRADRRATAAVLCRARAQFPAVVHALVEAGVPHEVVGLGGLLDMPVAVELVALLEVAHDPGRGDSLMRLLASDRVALGAHDLFALRDWAEHRASAAGERGALRADDYAIADALEELPEGGWESPRGRRLSDAAAARIATVAAAIDAVRTHTYLSPPELVAFAARVWNLDIEAAIAGGGRAREVDALVSAAHDFAAAADHATLGGFLAWLDAARAREDGLDAPLVEPDPGRVQVMTVHASKGLEWDVVAVPGCVDGMHPKFPDRWNQAPGSAYTDSGWLDGIGSLPWNLREDATDLPQFDWSGAGSIADVAQRRREFREAVGRHRFAEERRLFYVAVTRARSHVVLTGAWWGDRRARYHASPFVIELLDAGVVTADASAPEPEDDMREPEPLPPVPWPPAPSPRQQQTAALAAEVGAAREAGDTAAAGRLPWAPLVQAMLADRAAGTSDEVAAPAHLSTTALVSLRRDRDAFAAALRRPVPTEPTLAAHRGSQLHAWIEAHYGHATLLDEDALDDWAGIVADADLERLRANFEASEWWGRRPTDIEADVELPLAGVTVRSRIDAVFPAGDGLDRVTVVDWKSGRPPRDEADRAAREVQLAVYRLAWARWRGLDVDDVDAAFFYAATGETVRPAALLDEAELEALIRG